MRLYTQIIKWMGVIYVFVGAGLSIAGYVFHNEFVAGETMNTIGYFFGFFCYGFLIVVGGIYWLIFKPNYEIITHYNKAESAIFTILFIYTVFTLFYGDDSLENGLTITSSKLFLCLATTMMLGYFAFVGANNILKQGRAKDI